jgi:hypothetical protein
MFFASRSIFFASLGSALANLFPGYFIFCALINVLCYLPLTNTQFKIEPLRDNENVNIIVRNSSFGCFKEKGAKNFQGRERDQISFNEQSKKKLFLPYINV